MGKTVIRSGLSVQGIRDAQKALETYKVTLMDKIELFVKELAELGIRTAIQNIGDGYKKYITFEIQLSRPTPDRVRGILVASNTGLIESRWMTSSGVKTADVSPILMAEFGAGTISGNADAAKYGMGTGTFPGQTHAQDPAGWWYQDADTMEWHHSYGVRATMPVEKARDDMVQNIRRVARGVFG